MTSELRRISGNAGWLLSGKAFGGVLSLGYRALATRTLGLVDSGRFALVVAIGQATAGFVGFQTWQFVVRCASLRTLPTIIHGSSGSSPLLPSST